MRERGETEAYAWPGQVADGTVDDAQPLGRPDHRPCRGSVCGSSQAADILPGQRNRGLPGLVAAFDLLEQASLTSSILHRKWPHPLLSWFVNLPFLGVRLAG